MYWVEGEENPHCGSSLDQLDFVFQLIGSTLPQNYLAGFAAALHTQTNWWQTYAPLGFHLLIASEEGNGWSRGNAPEDMIYLSRRNRLVIRGPQSLSKEIESLSGKVLRVFRHEVRLKHKHNKCIKPAPTLYSRYMVCGDRHESEFISQIVRQLREFNIKCKKILCGKRRIILIDGVDVATRSIMFEDLKKADSVRIQALGLGNYQKFGCGVFIPHKSIKS